jgi:coproporphyrinogen III oxidase-like Fe-S oxidoreductase
MSQLISSCKSLASEKQISQDSSMPTTKEERKSQREGKMMILKKIYIYIDMSHTCVYIHICVCMYVCIYIYLFKYLAQKDKLQN